MFLNYEQLKLKFRMILTSFTVAIVTFWVSEMVRPDEEAVDNLWYEGTRYSFVISISYMFYLGLLLSRVSWFNRSQYLFCRQRLNTPVLSGKTQNPTMKMQAEISVTRYKAICLALPLRALWFSYLHKDQLSKFQFDPANRLPAC